MKKLNLAITVLSIAVLFSITALSHLSQVTYSNSKTAQITSTISLEGKDTCTTTFYDEVQTLYDTCVYYQNYTSCVNTTGPNTDCSLVQDANEFGCDRGKITVTR